MVSFSCEGCGDVLTKKKLDPHRNQCYGASFTCLDCMVHFQGNDYRSHTSCISEAQKYQGALYRPEKEKKKVAHKAYVEDVPDESQHNSHITIVDPPIPSAPSPPPAVPGFNASQDPVNVFDFLVASETPNASRLELPAPEPVRAIEYAPEENQDRDLVRVRFNQAGESVTDLVEYGSGPIPQDHYQTPAPKSERERERRKEKKSREQGGEAKSDKKRKRLHVETHDLSDHVMTDAPPVLHSGLTGGLKGLLSRPSVFPPSPDYSGGDFDASPGSPLKKTKNTKRERERGRGGVDAIGNNIMSLIRSTPSREHSADHPRRKKHHRRREESERPSRRMIEYQPMEGQVIEEHSGEQNQVVVFQPRAELLLSFINKGPESERGVSMNKALKRYHRERNASGMGLPRAEEEKELWKSLRLKQNERGEIVLFL